MTIAIITPSYQNDFSLATALCRSMDAMVSGDWVHHLIVPRRDLSLFRALEGPRRRVQAKEDIVSAHGYRSLPLPRRIRIPGLIDRRFKEQWWVPGAGRTSGWLVQQIIKLSAPDFTPAETLVFIDSDVQFVRPCAVEDLTGRGLVNLNQHSKGVQLATHSWMSNPRMTAKELIDYLTMLSWSALRGIVEVGGSLAVFNSQPHPSPALPSHLLH